jgi:hypothetical protein
MYIRTSDRLGQDSETEPGFIDVLKKAADVAMGPSPLVTGDIPFVRDYIPGIPKEAVMGKAIAAGAPTFQRAKAVMKRALPREKTCWIQTILNKTSGENLKVDGLYGPKTREAVRQFQRRSGLSADGMVGPRTNTALIQIALNHLARTASLPVDGIMDTRVQQEIKRFQSANKLAQDGIVGPRTRAAMIAGLGGQCIFSRPGTGPVDPKCRREEFEQRRAECLKTYGGCSAKCVWDTYAQYVTESIKGLPQALACLRLKNPYAIAACLGAKGLINLAQFQRDLWDCGLRGCAPWLRNCVDAARGQTNCR